MSTVTKQTTYVRRLKAGDVFYDPADHQIWQVARPAAKLEGATYIKLYVFPIKPEGVFKNTDQPIGDFKVGQRARGYIYPVNARVELI